MSLDNKPPHFNIGLIGVGKLGLPVSLAIAHKGHHVKGFDINPNIHPGVLPGDLLKTREEGLDAILDETLDEIIDKIHQDNSVQFVESVDELLEWSDLIFLAVQTPHDKKFDGTTRLPEERKDFNYDWICQAVQNLNQAAEKDPEGSPINLIIISTVLPGTIRQQIKPLIKSPRIRLCYNPFFIAMGTTIRDFLYPEFILLGNDNLEAKKEVIRFYRTFTDAPIHQTTLENAELIKVSYNTYITTKICLSNTLMELCDKLPGTDVDDVVTALVLSNRRILSSNYMRGGMGDGGGCHPRDNIAMAWLSEKCGNTYNYYHHIMVCREKQTEFLANLIEEYYLKMNKELPIMIMGLAFKAETNLVDGSPSFLLQEILKERNLDFTTHDPHLNPRDNLSISQKPTTKAIFFIATSHRAFQKYQFPKGSIVIDPHRYIQEPSDESYQVYHIGKYQEKLQSCH